MKTRSKRFLNIVLAFTLLLSMQVACNAATGGPVDEPTTESTTDSTVPSTAEPATPGKPGTWLVMMYEDADDEILE